MIMKAICSRTNIRVVAGSNVAQHIYFLQVSTLCFFIKRELVYDFHAFFGLVFSVAYLECAKGGGPGV